MGSARFILSSVVSWSGVQGDAISSVKRTPRRLPSLSVSNGRNCTDVFSRLIQLTCRRKSSHRIKDDHDLPPSLCFQKANILNSICRLIDSYWRCVRHFALISFYLYSCVLAIEIHTKKTFPTPTRGFQLRLYRIKKFCNNHNVTQIVEMFLFLVEESITFSYRDLVGGYLTNNTVGYFINECVRWTEWTIVENVPS